MEDGGFTLITKKSKKCHKKFFLPPEGSTESIEKALSSAKTSIENTKLCDWLSKRILEHNSDGVKIGRLYAIGNGHFDGNWCPGAHQLALCLQLMKKLQCQLYFQEIVCTNTENQYLKDLEDVVVIAPEPGFVRVKDHDFLEIIVIIHGIHELLEDYLKLNWGERLRQTVFICNDYIDVDLPEANFPYLKKFTNACTGHNLPPYEPNPVFFSQTSLLYIPESYTFD